MSISPPPFGSAASEFSDSAPLPLPAGAKELCFTETAGTGEAPLAPLRRLAGNLKQARAEIIGLMIFGSLAARTEIETAIDATLGEIDWPVLWIEGAACNGAPLAGVQAWTLVDGKVDRVKRDGRVVASRYRLGRSELCWAGEALPRDPSATPGEQTLQAFRELELALHAAGFGLGDLVRTWCYNDELLKWYREFNHARTGLYSVVDFSLGSAPASTGISAANRAGAALTLAGLAVRPLAGRRTAAPLASPLQCPAQAYGSAFSRAVELDLGSVRRVLVSGTASIEPGGATVWQGDPRKQVDLTMKVIEAILVSRGLRWAEVTRGIAYFKAPETSAVFEAWCRDHGWKNPPVAALHCDICRDDLLFELEVDAEAAKKA